MAARTTNNLTTRPLYRVEDRPLGMGKSDGWRVLAVEDSASARKLLQEILLRLGLTLPDLRLAANAREALQLFAEWRPNVVLLDMDLGRSPTSPSGSAEGDSGIDGHELGRRFLERDPGVKLVIVTALDRDSPPVKALEQKGAAAVITKPVLAARVREVLTGFAPPMVPLPLARDLPV
jgi:CheY-like chemotaxis protein